MAGFGIKIPGALWRNAGWATGPALVRRNWFGSSPLKVGAWFDIWDTSTLFQDMDGETPVTADGQEVALVLDKSGNGYNLTQDNDTIRPVYKTDGTLHWLEFAKYDWMEIAQNIPSLKRNVVMAVRLTTGGDTRKTLIEGAGNVGNSFQAMSFEVNNNYIVQNVDLTLGPKATAASFSLDTDYILSAGYDKGVSEVAYVRQNGVTMDSITYAGAALAGGAAEGFRIFANRAAHDSGDPAYPRFAVGRLYGMAYIQDFEAAEDLQEIEAVFANKIGVTLS